MNISALEKSKRCHDGPWPFGLPREPSLNLCISNATQLRRRQIRGISTLPAIMIHYHCPRRHRTPIFLRGRGSTISPTFEGSPESYSASTILSMETKLSRILLTSTTSGLIGSPALALSRSCVLALRFLSATIGSRSSSSSSEES